MAPSLLVHRVVTTSRVSQRLRVRSLVEIFPDRTLAATREPTLVSRAALHAFLAALSFSFALFGDVNFPLGESEEDRM